MNSTLVFVNSDIEIYHKESFCYSEPFSFVLKNYAELVDKKLVFSITPWNNDSCGVFYAKTAGVIVGVIVYDVNYNERNNQGMLGITFAFVDQLHRKKGIYKLMHHQLECWGKKNNFPTLVTTIHKNNLDFINTIKAQGLGLIMYKTIKYLKNDSNSTSK
jgi:hypothetical protein